MTTAALVLAAGSSSRLGEPKQLVRVAGETLLDRAVRVAGAAGCEPIVVVLGAAARAVAAGCDLRRAWVVVNAGWAEGMASSIRAGMELVDGFAEVGGVLVLTSDMPRFSAEHLRRLVAEPEEVVASAYDGRRGVPAYFPRTGFAELLGLRGDAGAREMLREAQVVELGEDAMDVDTAEDVARLRDLTAE